MSPLHFAAWYGSYAICELLIQNGASVTITNNMGQTPFSVAARFGKEQILELFMKSQPENICQQLLTATDNNGCTALSHACFEGKNDCVELLLKKGADATVVDAHGRSLLKLSRQNTSKLLVRHLQSQQAIEPEPAVPEPQPVMEESNQSAGETAAVENEDDDVGPADLVATPSFDYPAPAPITPPDSPTTSSPASRAHSPMRTTSIHAANGHIDTSERLPDSVESGESARDDYEYGSPVDNDAMLRDEQDNDDGEIVPADQEIAEAGADGYEDDFEMEEEKEEEESEGLARWLKAARIIHPVDVVRVLWALCGDSISTESELFTIVSTTSEEEAAKHLFLLLREHSSLPLNRLRDCDDWTPLMRCLVEGRILCAKVLLFFQAHLYLSDRQNNNCIHLCARRGQLESLQLVYEYIHQEYTVSLDFLVPLLRNEEEIEMACRPSMGNYQGTIYAFDLFDSLNARHCTPLLVALQEAPAQVSSLPDTIFGLCISTHVGFW